jgi:iron complex outermembrane receptor protein
MQTTGQLRLALMTSVFIAAPLCAAPAFAQQAPAPTEQVSSIDDIVVTARRREESLKDVPVAVTAVSAERLEQTGAADITTLQQQTPNATVQIARGTNSTLTSFIRGVGQQDPLWGFEPGVGLYVDDVYVARPQGAVLDIFDIERLEVLRGPQGTLYGRNTIGGAIKYVTKRLSQDPELTLKGAYGSYNQVDRLGFGPRHRHPARRRRGGSLYSRRLRHQPDHGRRALQQGRHRRPSEHGVDADRGPVLPSGGRHHPGRFQRPPRLSSEGAQPGQRL